MGLLEDAIREHLELKRRHGADADEVARVERDALGPPGRPTPLEDTAAAHAAEIAPPAREDPDPKPAGEPFDFAEDQLDEPAAAHEGGLLEPDFLDDDEPELLEEEPDLFAEGEAPHEVPSAARPAPESEPAPPEAEVEPRPEAAELPPAPPEVVPDPSAGIPAVPGLETEPPPAGAVPASTFEDAPPAEAAPEDDATPPAEGVGEEAGEDVLEETPEFLQETPEHDRLWFEQKPPRDFDFGS